MPHSPTSETSSARRRKLAPAVMEPDTTAPTSIERWDVVVVPFPFTDRLAGRRSPALMLSDVAFNASGHSILAMITTAAKTTWASDTRIVDLDAAGLPSSSVVRCNLFTLDNRLVLYRTGHLAHGDIAAVGMQLRDILPLDLE